MIKRHRGDRCQKTKTKKQNQNRTPVTHRYPRFSRPNGILHIMQKGIRWASQPSKTRRQRRNGARCPAAPPPLRAHTRVCVWASVWAWVGVGTSACAPHDAQVRARQPASARGREGVGARPACSLRLRAGRVRGASVEAACRTVNGTWMCAVVTVSPDGS